MTMSRVLGAGAALLILAGCSPASAPSPEQKPLTGGANQALVAGQAHLAGEAPRYGSAAWERQPDQGDAAVFEIAPGQQTPTVTAVIRGDRIAELTQHGALTRQTLAALAAAAGSPPGEHGPTAQKIEALIAEAKAKGGEVTATIGSATYAASASGDRVTASPTTVSAAP